MKNKFLAMTLMLLSVFATVQGQVTMKFEKTGTDARGYRSRLTMTNTSGTPIEGQGWRIYFSQLPTTIEADEAVSGVHVRCVNGNYFEIAPTEAWQPLAPGDSRTINMHCQGAMNRTFLAPEGFFFVGPDGQPRTLTCETVPFADAEYTRGVAEAYAFNETLASPSSSALAVTPSVKRAVRKKGTCTLEKGFVLEADYPSKDAARILGEKLSSRYGLQERAGGVRISMRVDARLRTDNAEYYTLHVTKKGVAIVGKSAHGVFNGTQTLLSLLRAQSTGTGQGTLPCVAIEDWPDLSYRGVMLDVARDFTTYDNLLRVLDLLAEYKLNALHFHFCDDEGWRIEIPGLPELTEVGGHRGYTLDEQTCLYPGYDGNWDASAPTSGNGFLTRGQFVSLLRYAAERHIRVMPEIESPGHARAAIVSMKARYNKYKDSDLRRATEYLLSDAADTSRYYSVQAYTDNVMNIAMPSTYAFMRKVITELAAMYRDAGVPLRVLHLGGDEVAEGAWVGSPVCQRFMQEKGLKTNEELSSYFYEQNIRLLDSMGIQYGGWQEIVSKHAPLNQDYFRARIGAVNCWTTVPEWGTDELTYQLANQGYPVLLSNVTNCYMDMAYNRNPDERGLEWGGVVDEATAFSLLPFDGYRSVHHKVDGTPIDWTHRPANKTQLTEQGRKNVLGVQGQLFAETIRGVANVEYCLFPKMLGLLERGWNAHPSWEVVEGQKSDELFREELSAFYGRIASTEMPYWQSLGVSFRLPNPGLSIADGVFRANSPIPGGEIRYTLDGTDPVATSPLYTAPVRMGQAAVVKARLFKNGRASVVSVALRP